MVNLAQSTPSRRAAGSPQSKKTTVMLALQLPFVEGSESMGDHDSDIVDAGSVD
jgi:hypothetical protein